MKQIVNYRHSPEKDFGYFVKDDGTHSNFDNVIIMSIDESDSEWKYGKPEINKVPFELLKKAMPSLTSSTLDSLLNKHFILEKEAKVFNGKLSEKVVGIYIID